MEKPTGPYTQSMETADIDPNRRYAISKQMGQASPHRTWERDPYEQGITGNTPRELGAAQNYARGYRIDSRNLTRTQYPSMEITPPAQVRKAGGT